MSPANAPPPHRAWREKFRDAFRGMKEGSRAQSSFRVHFLVAIAVVIAAAALRVERSEWCALVLCITVVLAAEMFNSALESMARAISGQPDPHLGNALDIASAAVLLASVGAVVVGAVIFGPRLVVLFSGW
jgi:diacylglycerol kinase